MKGFENLDSMFDPKTIALIGATPKKGSVGHAILRNLLGWDYEGVIYPVNLKRKSILGVKAYPHVADIPDEVDLAIIATPAATVPDIVEECGKAGVKSIVIISAGFKEAGKVGREMCDTMLRKANTYGMRIIGPNCLGFLHPKNKINASFSSKNALPGKIAFISQSGALCTAILDWSTSHNVGFSYFVSIGSMIDVGFHDLIDYFGNDPDTSSILIYMESLDNARKFLSAARAFARTKPIIVLKAGKSHEGADAAMSHTGTLAGDDEVYDAAFKRAGIMRVNTIGELFDTAQVLAMQPRPKGNRLAIVTNAGGPGVIATDFLIEKGGVLAKLSKETLDALDSFLPDAWSHANPVDVLGDADPERYRKAVDAVIKDKGVDGMLVVLTPQDMTDPSRVASSLDGIKTCGKPVFASWMGEDDVKEGMNILKKSGIPEYPEPENAIQCFLTMADYSKNLEMIYQTPATIPHAFSPKTDENRSLINGVLDKGRYVLTEHEAKQVLANYEIPVARNVIVDDREKAAEEANKIGFPVVMKIVSPDILHKTDVGGVRVGINDQEEAKTAFDEIMQSCKKNVNDADIHGILVEQMMSKRYELLIGCRKDSIFGPVIVFGMGGVAVEIYKDTNVGLPPLNMALAKRLMEETKIYRLLKGYRGMKGVDLRSIQALLYQFSYLVMDFPEIRELDINPFGVDEEGGVVLDAKIILSKEGRGEKPYSHMVISPYPKELVTRFKLKDGPDVLLRPIRPEDEPMEAEMFKAFSEDTQRYRFFHLIKDITHEILVRYTQIDYDREIAIIAEVNDEEIKKMAGVVRLIADPFNQNAEFAIVVADPWQYKGLGNKFTDYILEIARNRGISKVFAVFLKDNIAMHNMFKKRNFTISEHDDDSLYAELILSS